MISSCLLLKLNKDFALSGEIDYQNLPQGYCFALDKNFVLTKVIDCGGETEYPFLPTHQIPKFYLDTTNSRIYRNANLYTVSGYNEGCGIKLYFESAYQGATDFRSEIPFNRVSDQIISLDCLNINFFPLPIALCTAEKLKANGQIASGEEEKLLFEQPVFQITGFEDYEVINSFLDGEKRFVRTFIELTPYKLLAVNRNKIKAATDGDITAFYLSEVEQSAAAQTAVCARDILSWYNQNLFADAQVTKKRYFVSYHAEKAGGYNRNISIELDSYHNPKTAYGIYLLAHEIAHYWSMTDPKAAWEEQLLAEGAADWCSLLYFKSKGKFKRFYAFVAYRYFINRISSFFYSLGKQKLFPIHRYGYEFFNAIYKEFGEEDLTACIRHFALSPNKTKAGFLDNVKTAETEELYIFIKLQLGRYLR